MNLTKPQKLIYDMEKFAGGSIAIICGSMLINGKKDVEEIKKAVNALYRLNDALRIQIKEDDGEVTQTIKEYVGQDIKELCFENKAELDSYAEDYAQHPLDFHGNLCEINIISLPDQYGLLIKMHHMIGDAWTLSLLATQFNALLNGEETQTYSYVDYVANENAYIQSKRYEKDRAFFLEQFAKCNTATYLSEKENKTLKARRQTYVIDEQQTQKITEYTQKYETSAFTLFTVALSTYIHYIKNVDKFYIGTAVLNRTGIKEKNTAGMFINTVPMLIKVNPNKSFDENLMDITDSAFSAFRHQKYNYGDVLATLRNEHHFSEKLYDVLISYQNAKVEGGNVATTWYFCGAQNESLQIHIDDRDSEGVFRVHYDYQTEKFTQEEIDMLHQHICNILFDGVENPEKKLTDINVLTTEEKQKLLFDFNDTAVEYPHEKGVHQLFEEQVEQTPNNTAVVFENKAYTYAEINRMANCIAHALHHKGIGRNDIVPIIAHRSHLVIAAQFGVLKAGGAYLPIDPTFPQERITYMLEDASCKAALILDANAPTNVDFVIDLADENLYAATPENIQNINEPNDLCYVIYTSGSTGKPKGTMLTHRNVNNFCNNNKNNICYKCIKLEMKRIISTTTIGFDIYVTESLLALLNGLTVYYANDDESKMPNKLAKLVTDNQVEIIQTTPTKMKMYMQDKADLAWLSCLKCIILGGEIFPESLYEELRQYTKATIWNIYGPTETTVWSSVDEVTSSTITIGNPIANTQIYVLNGQNNLCPVGMVGELCIAGDGVGKGYLNRSELTAERFIDNPFGEGKLYKTGDLATYREDGKLLCYGRIDSQVKIRGLRVELGEIESVMNSFDDIVLSATTVKTHGEHQYLVGYYVAESDIDEKKLREHLLAQLPKYMCPHYFMRLEKIAFTPNGKIDRKNLPDIDFESRENHNEITLPETPMQQEVYEVLCDFIKGTAFGIDEDFFDLGMDSLTAINLTSALSKKYACELSVNDVYKFNTVEKMAEHLSQFTSHTKNHDLVLIKDGGDTNLFLIHGGNGVVGNFVQLSTQIENNYNWYGVDYPMNEEFYYPHVISIPELAAQYVERIRAVQPHGPYHLCGYCIGGQIVLEMAYLLEQAGEKVENIYLIAALVNDISNLTYPSIDDDDDAIAQVLFGDNAYNMSLIVDRTNGIWNAVYSHINNFELDMPVFRQKVIALMNPIDIARAVPDYDSADAKKILYFVNLIRSLIYGGRAYSDMRTVHAPICLFSPDKDKLIPDPMQNATLWQGHTTEKLTNYVFDGDHFSWFEEGRNAEFLPIFEKSLKENLADVEALTLLKAGNDKNIFFIHGGNGLATAFVSLCNKVNIHATCWGVGLPFNKENYQPHLRTIHEMAKWYIERIRKVQPRGPYSFGGYCIGAVIGLEMAYILEQEGETVEVLYGVSTLANDIACHGTGIDLTNEKDYVINLFADSIKNTSILNQASSENIWDTVYAHIAELEIDPIAFRERAFQIMQPVDIKRGIPNFDTCEIKDILYYINVIRSLCHVSTTLTEHRVINAPIYLFSADKDTMVSDIELNAKCWQSHTTADFENIIYDGDHFNMYEPENNDDFCEKFGNCYTSHRIENLTLIK